MNTDRKKPGVAFWATVVAALSPLLYLLSIGPACWFTSRTEVGIDAVNRIYQPGICHLRTTEPKPLQAGHLTQMREPHVVHRSAFERELTQACQSFVRKNCEHRPIILPDAAIGEFPAAREHVSLVVTGG